MSLIKGDQRSMNEYQSKRRLGVQWKSIGVVLATTLVAAGVFSASWLPKHAAKTKRVTPTSPAVAANFGKVPLAFEPNVGQSDSQVAYVAHGSGYTAFLPDSGPVLSLRKLQNGKPVESHQDVRVHLVVQ